MYEVVENFRVLNSISKKFNLDFCRKHKYYNGNPYQDNKGNDLPRIYNYKDSRYKLKYFDGCFNPFLIKLNNQI